MHRTVTLRNGKKVNINSRDILVGQVFSSEKGKELLDYWVRDSISNRGSDPFILAKEQGKREFIFYLVEAVRTFNGILTGEGDE